MEQGSRRVRARMTWILDFEPIGQPIVDVVLQELERDPDKVIAWIDEIDDFPPLPGGYLVALEKKLVAAGRVAPGTLRRILSAARSKE